MRIELLEAYSHGASCHLVLKGEITLPQAYFMSIYKPYRRLSYAVWRLSYSARPFCFDIYKTQVFPTYLNLAQTPYVPWMKQFRMTPRTYTQADKAAIPITRSYALPHLNCPPTDATSRAVCRGPQRETGPAGFITVLQTGSNVCMMAQCSYSYPRTKRVVTHHVLALNTTMTDAAVFPLQNVMRIQGIAYTSPWREIWAY